MSSKTTSYLKAVSLPIGAIVLILLLSDIVSEYTFLSSKKTATGNIVSIIKDDDIAEEYGGRKVTSHEFYGINYYFRTNENVIKTGEEKVYGELPDELLKAYKTRTQVLIEYSETDPNINHIAGYNSGSRTFYEWSKKYIILLVLSIMFTSFIGYEVYIKKGQ